MNKKYSLLLLFVSLVILPTITGVKQEQLIRYEMEEGGGDILIDSSGNSNHANANQLTWSNTNNRWGNYATYFDGNNDYASLVSPTNMNTTFTVSVWTKKDFTNDNTKCIFCIKSDNEQHSFRFFPDTANGTFELSYIYLNTTNSTQNISLYNGTINNAYHHYVFTVNTTSNILEFYRDGIKINNYTAPTPIKYEIKPKNLFIGTDYTFNLDYKGYMDEYRIFNGKLNETQVNELYNLNTVTLQTEKKQIINQTKTTSIITSLNPSNKSQLYYNPIEFNINLNQKSSCDFYINNKIAYSFEDKVADTFKKSFDGNSFKYFVYCSYVKNNTKFYEMSQEYEINVTYPNSQINFNFIARDFDMSNETFYVSSPCLKEGHSAIGLDEFNPYRAKYNPSGAYFEKVENGLATLNLSAKEHSFCLYNGRFIYNEDNVKTANYSVPKVKGSINLGELNLKPNTSNTYDVILTRFDVYDKTRPEAWNISWGALFSGFIMAILGFMILVIGGKAQNGKVALVGAILLLSAFGISINSLLAVVM